MGLNIPNLYADTSLLMFRELYATEKVHGRSARICWSPAGQLRFSPGRLSNLFSEADQDRMRRAFAEQIGKPTIVHGEYYGGRKEAGQGMSATYGEQERFIVHGVQITDLWLSVPQAENVAQKLGLDFVPYARIPATLEAIDAERDADSIVAIRCGMGPGHKREGVVLHPLIELTRNNGTRLIAKHRRDEYVERQNQPPPSVEPQQLQVLAEAQAIADEWVVPRRLEHVLQELDPPATTIRDTKRVIDAMVADVYKESVGEIVQSKEAAVAISRKTADLYQQYLKSNG